VPSTQSLKIGRAYKILYDDVWHHIIINEQKMELSPTQYRIFRSFCLQQLSQGAALAGMEIISYVPGSQLQYAMKLTDHNLRKHINRLNSRLHAHHLQIQSLHDGYVLLFTGDDTQHWA
jgi:hypothetical protein